MHKNAVRASGRVRAGQAPSDFAEGPGTGRGRSVAGSARSKKVGGSLGAVVNDQVAGSSQQLVRVSGHGRATGPARGIHPSTSTYKTSLEGHLGG